MAGGEVISGAITIESSSEEGFVIKTKFGTYKFTLIRRYHLKIRDIEVFVDKENKSTFGTMGGEK